MLLLGIIIEQISEERLRIREHKLLNPHYTQIAWSPKPDLNSPYYGYGFFISESPVGRIASHGGDGTGIGCQSPWFYTLYCVYYHTQYVTEKRNRQSP
jgi:hypothetical protein